MIRNRDQVRTMIPSRDHDPYLIQIPDHKIRNIVFLYKTYFESCCSSPVFPQCARFDSTNPIETNASNVAPHERNESGLHRPGAPRAKVFRRTYNQWGATKHATILATASVWSHSSPLLFNKIIPHHCFCMEQVRKCCWLFHFGNMKS